MLIIRNRYKDLLLAVSISVFVSKKVTNATENCITLGIVFKRNYQRRRKKWIVSQIMKVKRREEGMGNAHLTSRTVHKL